MKKTKSRNKRMSRGRGLLTRVMMTGLCILLVTGTGANTVRFTAHASESEDPGASAQVYETDAAEDSVLPPAEDETPSDAGEPLPAEETAPTGEETPPPAEERTPSAEDETPSDAGEPLPAEENPLPADGGPLPAEEEPLPAGEDLSADPEAAIAEEEAVEYVMEIAEITESVQPAMAAGTGGVYNKLMSLKSKFPHDKYWNHSVPSHEAYTNCAHEGYADTVTSAPCASHNALAGTSQHDCNYFDGGWQCCGFARKVFYDVFGERESSNSLRRIYDPNGIRVGDYVKFTWEHYAVVLSVSDTTFTVVECNLADSGAAYNCKIRWGHTYRKNQIEYYVHSNRYDEVNGSSQTAPVQPANPARPAIVNWGNDFYAYIINCGTDNRWIHTMYGNNGMELAAKPQYTPRQIWHFMRQEDGSYTIQNEYNGHYLMLDGNANRTVPGFHRYNSGTKTQKWYIIENGPYKGIINKSLYDQNVMRVLDVDNAATAAGTKLHIFDRNGTVAQSFNIWNLKNDNRNYAKPARPEAAVFTSGTAQWNADITSCTVTLTWNASAKRGEPDDRSYSVKIWKGTTASGTPFKTAENLTGTSCSFSGFTDGEYTIQVTAYNRLYQDWYTVGTAAGFHVNGEAGRVVKNVTLNKTSANLQPGKKLQLAATVTPSYARDKSVGWKSSNTKVATVSASGLVTAKAAGTATITVTSNNGKKTASCIVTVTIPDGLYKAPDGHLYYYKGNKKTVNSLKKAGSYYYYFGSNGRAIKNSLKTVGKNVYYFDKNGRALTKKLYTVKSGNATYYFATDGKAVKNKLQKYGSRYYYFGSNGKAVKGRLIKVSGAYRYFDKNGSMVVSKTLKINGVKWKFDKNGKGKKV